MTEQQRKNVSNGLLSVCFRTCHHNLFTKDITRHIRDFLIPRSFSLANTVDFGIQCMCVSPDCVYVLTFSRKLQKYSKAGKHLSTYETKLELPANQCVYYNDRLYFCGDNEGVCVLSTEGHTICTIGEENFGAIDVKNNLVFATCDDTVYIYNIDGVFIRSFECGRFDTINDHIQVDESLKYIYVGLNSMMIEQVTFQGAFRAQLGLSGPFNNMLLISDSTMLRISHDGFLWNINVESRKIKWRLRLPEVGHCLACAEPAFTEGYFRDPQEEVHLTENVQKEVHLTENVHLKKVFVYYAITKKIYIFEIPTN